MKSHITKEKGFVKFLRFIDGSDCEVTITSNKSDRLIFKTMEEAEFIAQPINLNFSPMEETE